MKDYISVERGGANSDMFFFRYRSDPRQQDSFGGIAAAAICRESGCRIMNCDELFGDAACSSTFYKHWGVGEWVTAVATTGAVLAGGAWLWRRYR